MAEKSFVAYIREDMSDSEISESDIPSREECESRYASDNSTEVNFMELYVKHPYKTLKMSQYFYYEFIGDSYGYFIDLSFDMRSNSLSKLIVKQSHFNFSGLL